jgi:hypothetical protein
MLAALSGIVLLGVSMPRLDDSCSNVDQRYTQVNALGDRYFQAESSAPSAAATRKLWSTFEDRYLRSPIPDPLCGSTVSALQARSVALWTVGAYGSGETAHDLSSLRVAVEAVSEYVSLRAPGSTTVSSLSPSTMGELYRLLALYSDQAHILPQEIGLDKLRAQM